MKRESYRANIAKLLRLAAAVVLVPSLLLMLLLTLSAYMETGYISTNNPAGELLELYADNVFLNILLLVLLGATLYLLYRHGKNANLKRLELLMLLWVFLLGLSFILSVKLAAPWYSDSYLVTYAAQLAAENDFGALDAYFVRFPYQLGFVLYQEVFFRLMGTLLPGLPAGYYCLALQGVNLLWLLLAYHALIALSWQLFQSRRIQKLTIVFLFFCLPPVFTCTFLYGNIPGFALGTVSLWMFSSFLREERLWQGLLCALTMGLAVMVKLNLLIFFVALVLVWVLALLKNGSIKSLLCLGLTAAAVFTLSNFPQTFYERRSAKEFGDGIPMIAWMAMGFSEGHAGPGWYKEDNTVTYFMESGMDGEATAANAKQVIRERLRYFSENPAEGLRFFSEKLRSQWNEPSYESLWINQVQSSYGGKGRMFDLICGSGARYTLILMKQFQQLIFLGMLLACVYLWRRRDICQCLPVLVVLGGLLYHLLFEAKSQYALPYFILMLPLAAYGFSQLFQAIENRK